MNNISKLEAESTTFGYPVECMKVFEDILYILENSHFSAFQTKF